jgi:hypothetical protein
MEHSDGDGAGDAAPIAAFVNVGRFERERVQGDYMHSILGRFAGVEVGNLNAYDSAAAESNKAREARTK